ncbi:ABC transporter ATP-binding protein [Nonomuraea sp. NEAU-A123]|uniref:ABC transporter ATP-binding protein n=1 Tax=Nonomuraea sp. NEAU-A123 TaxID=2839649 RepID=UPI001BE40657|nr:ABC transporter ATP-binding protein [Nonomuraea sp. NEAU-A123]MBT2229994.1 ABC transporter ATP-binding protein [Nonomuraea sp. NEAU-A123]
MSRLGDNQRSGGDDIVRLTSVRKTYNTRTGSLAALEGITIGCGKGALTAIIGPSRSGKSTLLRCASGLERPTSGSVFLDGEELMDLDDASLTRLRRDRLGFVFQGPNLLPALDVAENIALPLHLSGRSMDTTLFDSVIAHIGLADRLHDLPDKLSFGEQQRVAVARAVVGRAPVIFADEPTCAQDSHDIDRVLGLLRESARAAGQTVVVATHDPRIAAYADHVYFISRGRVVDELTLPPSKAVAERMAHLALWDRGEQS